MSAEAWGHGPFPRGALVIAGLAVGGALLLATLSRIGDTTPARDTTPSLAYRDLHFVDMADGGVSVIDVANGQQVGLVAPGTGGFLRATVRGLASERKHEGVGAEVPFRLAAHVDGQITLDDPATHRELALMAFGHSNAEVFAGMLGRARAGAGAVHDAVIPGQMIGRLHHLRSRRRGPGDDGRRANSGRKLSCLRRAATACRSCPRAM